MCIPQYDVIIIGAGPAGYVSAIRCAQLGLKTACVDNWQIRHGNADLGGTFINAGCVASMTLQESAKIYDLLRNDIDQHGISFDNLQLDVKKMVERKDATIHQLNQHIKKIFDQHDITCIHADGRLLSNNQVEITPAPPQSAHIIEAKNIILATGSSPIDLPCAPQDGDRIINSTQALSQTEVPETLGIIGSGVIGLEIGGIWNKLGSKVILLEAQETFLNAPDFQISQEAFKIYCNQGLDIRLGARVISTEIVNNQVVLEYEDQQGRHKLTLDKLVVAPGRQPNSENLAIPEVDLLLDENGFVHVDEFCSTNLPGVFAIGDLTLLGPMLAHKGLEEGVFVAELIAGQHQTINYEAIPSVIYTDPEIAWVGQTEQALKKIGTQYKTGAFPFHSSARAQSLGKTDGLVKIITQEENDQILGVHIIGAHASELIAEAVLAIEFQASAEDLARTIHAHPTISETIHEAALALANRSLHLVNP